LPTSAAATAAASVTKDGDASPLFDVLVPRTSTRAAGHHYCGDGREGLRDGKWLGRTRLKGRWRTTRATSSSGEVGQRRATRGATAAVAAVFLRATCPCFVGVGALLVGEEHAV